MRSQVEGRERCEIPSTAPHRVSEAPKGPNFGVKPEPHEHPEETPFAL